MVSGSEAAGHGEAADDGADGGEYGIDDDGPLVCIVHVCRGLFLGLMCVWFVEAEAPALCARAS